MKWTDLDLSYVRKCQQMLGSGLVLRWCLGQNMSLAGVYKKSAHPCTETTRELFLLSRVLKYKLELWFFSEICERLNSSIITSFKESYFTLKTKIKVVCYDVSNWYSNPLYVKNGLNNKKNMYYLSNSNDKLWWLIFFKNITRTPISV